MQILYLVGFGLLLTFNLLACIDSQGMFYHNSSLLSALENSYAFEQTLSPF